MKGRWDTPRPHTAADEAVDQQRREAEAEAQRSMTDAVHIPKERKIDRENAA